MRVASGRLVSLPVEIVLGDEFVDSGHGLFVAALSGECSVVEDAGDVHLELKCGICQVIQHFIFQLLILFIRLHKLFTHFGDYH